MVEVKTSEGLVVQVRVQEVEVVHSHDVIFPCEQVSEKDDSEDVPNGVCEGPVTRENPLFWNGEADRGVADEDVGLVHREVSSSEQLRELGFMETQRALPPQETQIEIFYNGLNASTSDFIDGSSSEPLIDYTYNEVVGALERFAQNDYQYPISRVVSCKTTPVVLEVDDLNSIKAQLASLENKIKCMEDTSEVASIQLAQ
ncbi:hypothetical protein V6N11_047273 [Hibiscus sabdariffa]|uniref:Uncharacterized protein n=1 Tax=Hibiscus sabdariffa TaxID=183260 RepID=A0ABR1ZQA3_9ROSI